MKKQITICEVKAVEHPGRGYARLGVVPADGSPLPAIEAGQFVEVAAPPSSGVMLRRPISVNDVCDGMLWLLVRNAGRATSKLVEAKVGDKLDLLLPLGHGFTIPPADSSPLLIGGGVGTAPLLYLGREMARRGVKPTFLVGARTAADLLLIDRLGEFGEVLITTDDGSAGEHGVVTQHSRISDAWTHISCCGPMPMMKAVASVARRRGIDCEVSLENVMACGLGACLCCVEPTVDGNICVCSEGPVFNINRLLWQD